MRSPEGQDIYNTREYRKIVQQINFIQNLADKGGKTEMTVTEYDHTSDQMFDLSKAGFEQCLDKMAKSLK